MWASPTMGKELVTEVLTKDQIKFWNWDCNIYDIASYTTISPSTLIVVQYPPMCKYFRMAKTINTNVVSKILIVEKCWVLKSLKSNKKLCHFNVSGIVWTMSPLIFSCPNSNTAYGSWSSQEIFKFISTSDNTTQHPQMNECFLLQCDKIISCGIAMACQSAWKVPKKSLLSPSDTCSTLFTFAIAIMVLCSAGKSEIKSIFEKFSDFQYVCHAVSIPSQNAFVVCKNLILIKTYYVLQKRKWIWNKIMQKIWLSCRNFHLILLKTTWMYV